ncbi:MAG: reverse transcriptase-like protein [Bacillota bacterium]
MIQRMKIYSDGGARGNPGPAAIAFVALNEQGEIVRADSRFIGVHTNNQAEYEALLMALQFAVEFGVDEVVCHLDSELVAKQLIGQYSVKDHELQQLWRKVGQLKGCFKKIDFVNVRREDPQIQVADELVNETLDQQVNQPRSNSFMTNSPFATVSKVEAKNLFVHTSIRTSNMDRSIDFYSKFLGLKLQSRREIKQTNAEIAFMQDAEQKGCTLELTFYRNQNRFSQPEYEERLFDHLGFEVADINKTLDAMRKEKVTVTDEPFKLNEKTTIAFVEDPDGTLIELIEHR